MTMREILFRGKAANRKEGRAYRTKYKNGDWVHGMLTDPMNWAGFAEMTNTSGVQGIEVDRNTVCQYTGMTDKNGNAIYEGDIIKTIHGIRRIVFEDGCFGAKPNARLFADLRQYNREVNGEWEVIGNIHDNPELLEVTDHA